jgi:hypothetical protein
MLRRLRTAFALLALTASVAGCSGSSGFFGTIAAPKGNIAIASYPGGQTLDTSQTNPYVVDDTFSVAISETNYDGPYTITLYSWSNGFNEPCFVPHTMSATIYTFSPDHANPATDPGSEPLQSGRCRDGPDQRWERPQRLFFVRAFQGADGRSGAVAFTHGFGRRGRVQSRRSQPHDGRLDGQPATICLSAVQRLHDLGHHAGQ